MMRIAYDHQAFVLQPYGGITRYFSRLAQEIAGLEQEVQVFAPLHRNRYLLELPKDIVRGRYINGYPYKSTRLMGCYNRLSAQVAIQGWRPDLVHETYFAKKPTIGKGRPSVVTVFDMIHELFPQDFPESDRTAELKKIAVSRAEHVLCISENTKQDLMRLLGVREEKVSVVHLGFDQFSRAERVDTESTGKRPFLLYVGQRGGYKNFVGMLRAFSLSQRLRKDFDLIAFGGGTFSAAEQMEIEALGFSGEQVQQVSGGDDVLGSLYARASAFVYPSKYEGFGIPPLEAMAHDCPVVSSNTSSMPEVLGEAVEYADPSNADDIRRAIEQVVYSEESGPKLKEAGRLRLSQFSWEKCAINTLNVYQKLI